MNAKFTALFVAITLLAPNFGQAGQPIGTAKARGDYRGFYQSQTQRSRSVARSQPAYRYSTPRSAPVIVQTPVIREVPGPVVAQAPAPDASRRFSQAPAGEGNAVASAKPCPESAPVASQPNSGRRYSYAPAPQYSGNPVRRYSGNDGRSSQPTWALPKTAPGKYNAR
jgi:hypothetical protein